MLNMIRQILYLSSPDSFLFLKSKIQSIYKIIENSLKDSLKAQILYFSVGKWILE